MKKFFGLLLAAVMTFSLVACGAQNVPSDNTSDDYPSGPITCIVPYAAGGGSDVLTRTIMKYISLPNNVNMVAVNVEGASGYTGCLQAAKSDPDGYTILAHNPMDVVGFTLSGSTTEELYKGRHILQRKFSNRRHDLFPLCNAVVKVYRRFYPHIVGDVCVNVQRCCHGIVIDNG